MSEEYKNVTLEKYREKSQIVRGKLNFLIYGKAGVGKTCLLDTCPGQIFLHNFDPGGGISVKEGVESGKIIISDFSKEDLDNPTAYTRWEKEYNEMVADKVFENISFYCMDSLTSFLNLLLAAVVKKEATKSGSKNTARRFTDDIYQADYGKLHNFMKEILYKVTTLPCNVILFAHLDLKEDASKVTHQVLSAPGQMKTFLPAFFDEYYYMESGTRQDEIVNPVTKKKEWKEVVNRTLLTQNYGEFECRTRMGKNLFEKKEKADVCHLLTKAGFTKFL